VLAALLLNPETEGLHESLDLSSWFLQDEELMIILSAWMALR